MKTPDDASVKGSKAWRLLSAYLLVHAIVCVASLLYALEFTTHHIAYNSHQLPYAIASVAIFCLVASLFVFARFSFGYFIGFYLYTMVIGFIWLSWFTDFTYDHQAARISAAASAVVFLLPALFLSMPLRQAFRISPSHFDFALHCLLAAAAATIALAAIYNFRLIGLERIYEFRASLEFPTLISYLIGIVSSAVLPFLFACFVVRDQIWRAGLVILLLFLIYPVTLTKVAFFAPIWLVGLAALSRMLEARATVVLSVLLPTLVGVVLFALFKEQTKIFFGVVNFRMMIVPSSAINVYSDFFSRHELTHFCQISFLSKILDCPYHEPLSVIMEKTYGLGFFNASLFATEGIASVGQTLAPASVFVCGLVIALGNCASNGLPSRVILLSSAVLAQYFLNVPLTTMMLTHGTGLMFLLWHLTPREIFRLGASSPAEKPR